MPEVLAGSNFYTLVFCVDQIYGTNRVFSGLAFLAPEERRFGEMLLSSLVLKIPKMKFLWGKVMNGQSCRF